MFITRSDITLEAKLPPIMASKVAKPWPKMAPKVIPALNNL